MIAVAVRGEAEPVHRFIWAYRSLIAVANAHGKLIVVDTSYMILKIGDSQKSAPSRGCHGRHVVRFALPRAALVLDVATRPDDAGRISLIFLLNAL